MHGFHSKICSNAIFSAGPAIASAGVQGVDAETDGIGAARARRHGGGRWRVGHGPVRPVGGMGRRTPAVTLANSNLKLFRMPGRVAL